jgi:hypothetical protein
MAGTILIHKDKSMDVRTIDFEKILESLRQHAKTSAVAASLLQTKDDFGMDMICADELSALDFTDFYHLLGEIRKDFQNSPGLMAFIDQVRELAQTDERFHH